MIYSLGNKQISIDHVDPALENFSLW